MAAGFGSSSPSKLPSKKMRVGSTPSSIDALMTTGIDAQRHGDLKAAEACYRNAFARGLRHPILLSNLATVLLRTQRCEEAEHFLRETIRSNPNFSDAYINLGNLLRERGALGEANVCIIQGLELQPQQPEALISLGILRQAQNKPEEAHALAKRALRIKPNHVAALVLLASLQMWRKNNEEALRVVLQALQIEPGHLEALTVLAQILEKLGRPDEASAIWRKAAELGPDFSPALLGLAELLMQEEATDALSQARQLIERVLAKDRVSGEAYAALANLLNREGEHQKATTAMQVAMEADPENLAFQAIARRNLGIQLFSTGTFSEAAWAHYEARWIEPGAEASRYSHFPRWDGSQLDGQLLVTREQGIGDEVLFLGFLREIIAAGHQLVIEVSPRLLTLLRPCFPDATLVTSETSLDALDINAVVPLGSLGMYCRNDRSSFAFRNAPYLKAPPVSPGLLRQFPPEHSRKLKVGLVWRSNNRKWGFRKSLFLRDLLPLSTLSFASCISLQHEALSEEEHELIDQTGIVLPEADFFGDLEALACWIQLCDVVVTVSTSTAHIACAMGKPTWILLPSRQVPHWYWGMEGDQTPWYPSARLFRQSSGDDWSLLVKQVGEDLQAFAQQRHALF
ncbi:MULTISPECIES: tetratricopeptide repeat protein [unclassified Synechococcus]|nr:MULTISPECIES: tetratricopeptide repeat protein [unclassified Synechococcus]WFN59525.1 tetratricopeptide repeat protein [Synechococcus sp. CCFWC 502]